MSKIPRPPRFRMQAGIPHRRPCDSAAPRRWMAVTSLALGLAIVLPAWAGNERDEEDQQDVPVAGTVFPVALFAAPSMQPAAAVSSLHHQSALTVDTTYQNSTVSGNKSMILGSRSSINGNRSNVYGTESHARGDDHVAVGYAINMNGSQGTAIGTRAATNGVGATSLGHDAYANGQNAISIGSGSRAQHVESIAIGANSVTTGSNQLSVGNSTRKRRIVNVADGNVNASSSDAVTGKQLNTTNTNVTAARNAANAAQSSANTALSQTTALRGLINQVSTSGNVRVGAENSGLVLDIRNRSNANRKVTGVADGTLSNSSNDAVTGRQLHATQLTIDDQRRQIAAHNLRIGDNRIDLERLRAEFEDFDPDLEGVVRFGADGNVDAAGGAIQRVAAGDVSSAASTDAVNGGQLFATNDRVRALEDVGRFFRIGTDDESEPAAAGWFGVAMGESSEASTGPGQEGGTAVGSFTKALGTNSVALGRAAYVLAGATDGFALGANSRVETRAGVALGAASRVGAGAENAVALGYDSYADRSNVVSVGNLGLKRRLINVDRGIDGHDAVTVEQMRLSLFTLGGGADVDAGGGIIAPTYTVQGAEQRTVGDALATLDSAIATSGRRIDQVETRLHSMFQDAGHLRADGRDQISFAGASGMVLSNVANGLVAAGSREAVNGGQLHAVQQQLNGRMDGLEQRVDDQAQPRALAMMSAPPGEEGAPAADINGAPPIASAAEGAAPVQQTAPKNDATASPTPQVDTAELERMLARANEYSDGISREVDARLNRMDKRFNRMAAMSSAQSAMAMNTAGLATYNRLGAGVGYSDGESAMAVGYQRVLNDKGSATFSLNGAFTNSGERTLGVGVGIGW